MGTIGATLVAKGALAKTKAMAGAATAAACCCLLLSACAANTGADAASSAAEGSSAYVDSSVGEDTSADFSAFEESDTSASVQEAFVPEEPAADYLDDLLGEETAAKLIDQAQTDPDANWVAAHPDAYEIYDPAVQAKLLKLAADDPHAVSFVRNFLDEFIAEEPDYHAEALKAASPALSVPETQIPHLYQWDARWGYTLYNGDAFGLSGCGPTTLAMVYQGLTGKDDITPYDMGCLAVEGGYVVEWVGTANSFFAEVGGQLGLRCEELDITQEAIVSALKEGRPIIANVGPGMFTQFGHFFVFAGLSKDGKVILNDPYSWERSSQLWDPEVMASEAIALYAFSLPNEKKDAAEKDA